MQLETSPEDFIFVIVGLSKLFVTVISLETLPPGTIFPKFIFPGPRSKPEFSPAMNFVGIVCLSSGAFRIMIEIAKIITKIDIMNLFFLCIFGVFQLSYFPD